MNIRRYTIHRMAAVVFLLFSLGTATIAKAADPTKTGKWVNPVEYFHLDRYGDKLDEAGLYKAMWEKERHITGMAIRVYSICFAKADPRKSTMEVNEVTYRLYINNPTAIRVVSDMRSFDHNMGIYKLGADDFTFSFNEGSHTYSYSYSPNGTYDHDDPSRSGSGMSSDEDIDYEKYDRLTAEIDREFDLKLKSESEAERQVHQDRLIALKAELGDLPERISQSIGHDHYKSTDATDIVFGYTKNEGMWGSFLNRLHDPAGMTGYKDEDIYVVFKVEEVQIDGDDTMLSEEQRTELTNQLDNLVEALEDYTTATGDHTGPIPSAMISVISTIGSLLLANGISSITGNLGDIFGGGGGGGTPPVNPTEPTPQQPNVRRDEDEVLPKPEPEPEPEPEPQPKPEPEPQPEPEDLYWKEYMTEENDGTLTMRDPATGKDIHYYPQEDGEYLSDSGFTYDRETIAENLRVRAENSDYFNQIATKAEEDVQKQREQAEAEAAETQARGDAYREEQEKEREAAEKREQYIQKLAEKYGVDPSDVDTLRKTIEDEQKEAEREGKLYQKTANILDKTTTALEVVDKASEITINVLGECVPGGKAVKNVYTFAHSVAAAGGEAWAEGKSGQEFTGALAIGALDGGIGVFQNLTGDMTKNVYVEGALQVGSEGIRKGLNGLADPKKSTSDILKDMGHGMTSKLNSFVIGKGIEKGFATIGKGADQTINPEGVNLQNDTSIRFETTLQAQKYKSFMRGSTETGIGSIKHYEAITNTIGEVGGLTDNFGADHVSNFVTDEAIPAAAEIPNDIRYYADTVKEFSANAAQYRANRLGS